MIGVTCEVTAAYACQNVTCARLEPRVPRFAQAWESVAKSSKVHQNIENSQAQLYQRRKIRLAVSLSLSPSPPRPKRVSRLSPGRYPLAKGAALFDNRGSAGPLRAFLSRAVRGRRPKTDSRSSPSRAGLLDAAFAAARPRSARAAARAGSRAPITLTPLRACFALRSSSGTLRRADWKRATKSCRAPRDVLDAQSGDSSPARRSTGARPTTHPRKLGRGRLRSANPDAAAWPPTRSRRFLPSTAPSDPSTPFSSSRSSNFRAARNSAELLEVTLPVTGQCFTSREVQDTYGRGVRRLRRGHPLRKPT